MAATIILILAVAQWLAFGMRYVTKREGENAFLVASFLMASVWLFVAPQRTMESTVAAPVTVAKRGASCATIILGMPEADVRAKMGQPSSIVSEADTQGPGADAWIYADAGCVAHILNGQVRAVGFE
jgi:hypothetical protein